VAVTRAKPTRAQQRRLADKILELTLAGASSLQMQRALGISQSTLDNYRRAMAAQLRDAPRNVMKGLPVDPEPYDWVAEPPLAAPPPYQLTDPTPLVASMVAGLAERNAPNRLAFCVQEAQDAGDEAWFQSRQVLLLDARDLLDDLLAVLADRDARSAALGDGRHDLREPLRGAGGRAMRLPPKGSGMRPTRIHAELWTYQHAGLPVTDSEIARIASRSGAGPERVRKAAREMGLIG
jgi:hypothetical protein